MAEGAIDRLSIEIGASSEKAVQDINKVVDGLKRLKAAVNETGNAKVGKVNLFQGMNTEAVNAMSKIDLLKKKLAALKYELGQKMALGKIDDKGIANAALQIKNIQAKIDKSVLAQAQAAQKAAQQASAQQQTQKSPKVFNAPAFNPGNGILDDLKQIGSTFLTNINPAVKTFTGLLNKALSVVKKIASSVLQIAKNLAKATMKKIGNFVDKHALSDLKKMSGAVKNFMRSLGRIAFYRAIRSMIKAITDAFQEGLQNAYQFSASIETEAHRFAAAMDSMKAAGGTMKNQLGSAFISLLAAIAPIVNTIIALITRLAVALSQLFAAFTGGTYLRAKNLNAQMAADTAGGAAAAKEWKNQLMGFDEINRLEAPSDGGGGGGGGGIDPGDLFEEVEIDKSLKDFVDAFKEALMNGDWEGAGQMLAEKLNSLIPSEEQVAEWGRKLGYALNGAIQTAYYFLKYTDFQAIGQRIGTFINNALNEIDFTMLGRLWMKLKTALWEVIMNAVYTVNWAAVGKKLSDFIKGALDELAEFIEKQDPEKIAQAIKDFFGNIDVNGISAALLRVLRSAFVFVNNIIATLLPEGMGIKLSSAIGDEVDTPANELTVLTAVKTLLTNAFTGLTLLVIKALFPEDIATNISSAIAEKIDESGEGNTTTLKDAIGRFIAAALIGIAIPKSESSTLGEDIANEIAEIIANADFAAIHNVLSYKLDTLFDSVFGTNTADRWLYMGEYAGDQIIKGLIQAAHEGQVDEEYINWVVNPTEEALEALVDSTDLVGEMMYLNMVGWSEDTLTDLGYTVEQANQIISTLSKDTGEATQETADVMAAAKSGLLSETEEIASEAGSDLDEVIEKADDTGTALEEMEETSSGAMQGVTDAVTSGSKTVNDKLGAVSDESGKTGDAFGGLASEGASAMGDLSGSVAANASSIIGHLQRVAQQALATIRALNRVSYYGGGATSRFNSGPTITPYASGGFVEDGLFMANHGEVVGTFSNGRTAVANNEQITNGIASAVYGAFMRAFGESGAGQGSSGPREVSINVNGREFYRATYDDFKSVQRERGFSMASSY